MSNRVLANQIKNSIIEDYDSQCLWHYSFENYEWMMYDMIKKELEKDNRTDVKDLSKSDIERIVTEVYAHACAEWIKESIKFSKYSMSEYAVLLYNKLLDNGRKTI